MKTLSAIFGIALITIVFASPAQADPIAVGTATWDGAVFSVSLDSVAGDMYTFTYTADFTGLTTTNPNSDYLYGINFKPNVSPGQVTSVTFNSATAGQWINWTTEGESLSNGNAQQDCTVSNGGTFVCAIEDWTQAPNLPTFGNSYSLTFTLQIGGTISDPAQLVLDAPLRALLTSDGIHFKPVSLTTGTSVPEPTSLLLLGLGIAGVAAARSRVSSR